MGPWAATYSTWKPSLGKQPSLQFHGWREVGLMVNKYPLFLGISLSLMHSALESLILCPGQWTETEVMAGFL